MKKINLYFSEHINSLKTDTLVDIIKICMSLLIGLLWPIAGVVFIIVTYIYKKNQEYGWVAFVGSVLNILFYLAQILHRLIMAV